MDLGQLETFLAIARFGSFSRAAAKLHRSQPAISRRLALLEAEIGAPLFERVRKRVQLTDAGRALRPHAEAALAASLVGIAAVREQLGQGAGTVSLALVGTLVDAHLARVLANFADTDRRSRLTLTTHSSETISERVREGESVLGVRYLMDRAADLMCEQIGWERMVVVAAHDASSNITAQTCWVGFSTSRLTNEAFGPLLQKRLENAGFAEPSMMLVDSLSAQKRLVEAGMGFGFLPESSVRQELTSGTLQLIRAAKIATRIPICIVHRRAAYLSPAARELASLLRLRWKRTVHAG